MGQSQWGLFPPWGMPDFLQTRLPSVRVRAAFIELINAVSLNSEWQSGREIKVRQKLIYIKPDGCQTTKQPVPPKK